MTNRPIKATSSEFNPDDYFLIQTNEDDKRYIISSQNKEKLHKIITDFLEQINDTVQIQLVVINEEDEEQFFGDLNKNETLTILSKHSEVIFHHGFHDLMLRNPESGDYIAFDEHGLIFIYSNLDFRDYLNKLEIQYLPNEKIIYELNHLHYSIPNGNKLLNKLIEDLRLKK